MQKRNPRNAKERFYADVMDAIQESGYPYMLGGTYALWALTGINRETKDLDIFCKAGDYPRILHLLQENGFTIEVTDERWLAKILKGKQFIDLIFGAKTGIPQVDETWFTHALETTVFSRTVSVLAPEEFIVSKAFRFERDKYDGADIHHVIVKHGAQLDWKLLLARLDQYWEVLLAHLMLFRFAYPADRDLVPRWLMEDLLSRVTHQLDLPASKDKVCRGNVLSWRQYTYPIEHWGYNEIK